MLTKQACYAKIAKSGANTRCKMDVWPVGQAVKTEASHAFNIGSIPVRVIFAPLAQLVEQLTLNQWVLGSSPRRRTMYMNAAAFYIRARGPLVKWLRQRPLTPLTSVRIRYGSPFFLLTESGKVNIMFVAANAVAIVGAY